MWSSRSINGGAGIRKRESESASATRYLCAVEQKLTRKNRGKLLIITYERVLGWPARAALLFARSHTHIIIINDHTLALHKIHQTHRLHIILCNRAYAEQWTGKAIGQRRHRSEIASCRRRHRWCCYCFMRSSSSSCADDHRPLRLHRIMHATGLAGNLRCCIFVLWFFFFLYFSFLSITGDVDCVYKYKCIIWAGQRAQILQHSVVNMRARVTRL